MKLKLAGFAATGALAVAMLAFAQPPGFGRRGAAATDGTAPAPMDAVKTYLALTDSQITGFDAIRQTARTAEQPIAEQLRTKMQALRAATNATPVVAATITSLTDGLPTTLNDMTSFGPGDATFAYQWDISMAPGSTFIISKILSVVPEPSSAALLSLGILGFGMLRRRTRKA